jgi:hypothetical protein
MEELKKWVREICENYSRLNELNALTDMDIHAWKCYKSVGKKIEEVEAQANKTSSNPMLCDGRFCKTMNVKIKDLKQIVKLSKKTISELRKLNPERAYNGKELTKYQLIFQIVFLRDSPTEV